MQHDADPLLRECCALKSSQWMESSAQCHSRRTCLVFGRNAKRDTRRMTEPSSPSPRVSFSVQPEPTIVYTMRDATAMDRLQILLLRYLYHRNPDPTSNIAEDCVEYPRIPDRRIQPLTLHTSARQFHHHHHHDHVSVHATRPPTTATTTATTPHRTMRHVTLLADVAVVAGLPGGSHHLRSSRIIPSWHPPPPSSSSSSSWTLHAIVLCSG